MKPAVAMLHWVRLAVIVAAPMMAFFGKYTLDGLGESRSAWALAAVLAHPLAPAGVLGFAAARHAPQRSNLVLAGWALGVAARSALLV